MVRWMCNGRLDDELSTEELRTRLNLKSNGECL